MCICGQSGKRAGRGRFAPGAGGVDGRQVMHRRHGAGALVRGKEGGSVVHFSDRESARPVTVSLSSKSEAKRLRILL